MYVDGSVRTRRYTDAVGNERSQTEVVIQPYAGTCGTIHYWCILCCADGYSVLGEFLALQKTDVMIQQFDDDMGSA